MKHPVIIRQETNEKREDTFSRFLRQASRAKAIKLAFSTHSSTTVERGLVFVEASNEEVAFEVAVWLEDYGGMDGLYAKLHAYGLQTVD
jgi:hypothetical protein